MVQSFRIALPTVVRAHSEPRRSVLLGVAVFLAVFGSIMVLSSSSVEEIAAGQSAFTAFWRQALFAAIGLPLMFMAARTKAATWRRLSMWILGAGVFLQLVVLITPLGETIQGNRNWLRLGPISMQPSEVIKLGVVLVVAVILDRKAAFIAARESLVREVYVPIAVVAIVSIGPIAAGKDLGTSVVVAMALLGVLVFAGVDLRHLLVAAGAIGVVALILAVTRASRLGRISTWLGGCGGSDQNKAACWQPVHAEWALAAGGLFGRGLGNSTMKWSWLPEADNDFIFAIIGEELGLIGAIVVLALFIVIAASTIRIARARSDVFGRAAVGGVLVWVIGQAFVNIAVVLGLLPVLGVPLPLISAGGSSMVVTLVGLGAAASFGRRTAETVASAASIAPDGDAEARSRAKRGAARAAQRTAGRDAGTRSAT